MISMVIWVWLSGMISLSFLLSRDRPSLPWLHTSVQHCCRSWWVGRERGEETPTHPAKHVQVLSVWHCPYYYLATLTLGVSSLVGHQNRAGSFSVPLVPTTMASLGRAGLMEQVMIKWATLSPEYLCDEWSYNGCHLV